MQSSVNEFDGALCTSHNTTSLDRQFRRSDRQCGVLSALYSPPIESSACEEQEEMSIVTCHFGLAPIPSPSPHPIFPHSVRIFFDCGESSSPSAYCCGRMPVDGPLYKFRYDPTIVSTVGHFASLQQKHAVQNRPCKCAALRNLCHRLSYMDCI